MNHVTMFLSITLAILMAGEFGHLREWFMSKSYTWRFLCVYLWFVSFVIVLAIADPMWCAAFVLFVVGLLLSVLTFYILKSL